MRDSSCCIHGCKEINGTSAKIWRKKTSQLFGKGTKIPSLSKKDTYSVLRKLEFLLKLKMSFPFCRCGAKSNHKGWHSRVTRFEFGTISNYRTIFHSWIHVCGSFQTNTVYQRVNRKHRINHVFLFSVKLGFQFPFAKKPSIQVSTYLFGNVRSKMRGAYWLDCMYCT